jgi:chromosome segregation ATPase
MLVLYLLRRNHPLNLSWGGLHDGADAAGERARAYLSKYQEKHDFSDTAICTGRMQFDRRFVTLLRRMLRFDPERRISFAAVVECSSNPSLYELNLDRLEVNLAAQKSFTTSQTNHLAELAKQLETNGQLLVSAEARARQSEASCEATETKLRAAQHTAENANAAFAHAQSHADESNNSFLRQMERVENLEKQIASLVSADEKHRDESLKERERLTNAVDAANLQVEEIDLSTASERIEYARQRSASAARIAELEAQLASKNSQLDEKTRKAEEWERRLTASAARIAEFEAQHGSTIAQLDETTRKATDFEAQLTASGTRIAELESQHALTIAQLGDALKKAATLSTSVDAAKQHTVLQAARIVCSLYLSIFSAPLL